MLSFLPPAKYLIHAPCSSRVLLLHAIHPVRLRSNSPTALIWTTLFSQGPASKKLLSIFRMPRNTGAPLRLLLPASSRNLYQDLHRGENVQKGRKVACVQCQKKRVKVSFWGSVVICIVLTKCSVLVYHLVRSVLHQCLIVSSSSSVANSLVAWLNLIELHWGRQRGSQGVPE